MQRSYRQHFDADQFESNAVLDTRLRWEPGRLNRSSESFDPFVDRTKLGEGDAMELAPELRD